MSAKTPERDGAAIVEVAVFAPLRRTFDYLMSPPLPGALRGRRVRVPFGRATRIGVVLGERASSEVPAVDLKPVTEVLDTAPLLGEADLGLALWAARYYQHAPGDAIAATLPTWLRRHHALPDVPRTAWRMTPDCPAPGARGRAAPRRDALLERLARGPCTVRDFADLVFDWRAALRRLVARGWVEHCDPAPAEPPPDAPCVTLNDAQSRVAARIAAAYGSYTTIALAGVTGSGKTEIYLHAVGECLAAGGQVLVLVPEIGLTRQLVDRFRRRFGARVQVLHSALGDRERALTWADCASGKPCVLIGTRSAVWVPLPALRLVVVDEEHDASYKQQEGFRYSARDVAIVRGQRARVPVVLGSATPSLETLANAKRRKYELEELSARPGDVRMPSVSCLDVRGVPLDGGLSDALVAAMHGHLARGGQVMLFLNRRGYAPVLMCRSCGEPRRCDRCDAYLVFHKRANVVRCHHCDRQWRADRPPGCCDEADVAEIGLGTERIEQAVRERFPDREVRRLDRDAARRQGYFDEVMAGVADRSVDILIGTQMLAKGFDFAGVTLVGVVDADGQLYSIDFRAEERLAQLLVQVAGRAGRIGDGEVLVQTHHPHHPVLRRIIDDGYRAWADAALAERREACLPPFASMTVLRAESAKAGAPLEYLGEVRARLAAEAPGTVDVGFPIPAVMERRAGRYRALLVVSSTSRSALSRHLAAHVERLETLARRHRVRLAVDVDAQDTL